MRLWVDAKALDLFRKKALKKYPSEFGALLYGTVSPRRSVRIKRFLVPSYLSSPDHWWYDRAKTRLIVEGLRWLGSIHTHPDAEGAPSLRDWTVAGTSGEIVQGICRVHLEEDPKTTVTWFIGNGLLDAKTF